MFQFRFALLVHYLMFPFALYASFIESTMGTAVVNDATAVFHNPAALTLLKKSQVVALGSRASSRSRFSGQSIESIGGFTQSGTSSDHANFHLPSAYASIATKNKLRFGFAVLSDKLNSDIDEPSILRYMQSSNQIKNMDYILGLGIPIKEFLSIGAALTYTDASFISNRITGFPSIGVPDSQSHNVTNGQSYGWNAGILIKPFQATLIGFDYRSMVSYQFRGRSEFEGPPAIFSNHYSFNFWTPARSVVTLSHYLTPNLGFISTAQRVEWSVFKNVTMQGLATQMGFQSLIIPQVVAPYYFRDSWIFTLGGIKNLTPEWVVRVAGTYNQSPGNGAYRIISGDDYIIGASTGYKIFKNLTLDGSYAHAFTKKQAIDINSRSNRVFGINRGYRDSISLKMTFTV